MKYIVYCTENVLNNKIYIGVHGTNNPDKFDGYLGNGVIATSPKTYKKCLTAFQCAVEKYGPKNFMRKTLQVFDYEEDAYALETLLVDKKFIERLDVYNITVGGGHPPRLNKNIYQYDLNGKYIKTWESIKNITDCYSINKDRIRMVIDDKRSFDQSYWSEIKYSHLDIKEYRPSSRGSIRQYTKEGKLLNSFKNTTEAAKALDIDRQKIINAIYGKYATSGYWFLKEEETIESYLDGSIKNEQPVYQYTNTGDFINKYDSVNVIKKTLKVNKNDLKRAVKNNALLNNFYWSYSKYNNIVIENPELQNLAPRKVYQYTLEGDFVKEWESITLCKKEYPSVLQVLLGNRQHCHKFKFSFNKLMI